MAKPPHPAIRSLVLVAAVALLGTAVCSKTQKASDPEPAAEIDAAPPTTQEPPDAGQPAPALNQQTLPVVPAKTPVVPAKTNKGNKNTKEKEFFPATKSGGMF